MGSELRCTRRNFIFTAFYCQLCSYKRCTIAVLFLLLSATAFIVDLFGKGHWGFPLAALLLSAFGFAVTIYTTCSNKEERSRSQVSNQLSIAEVFTRHKKVAALVFFILMGTTSIVLAIIGKNRRGFLVASFLLSLFGFMASLYTTLSSKETTTSELIVFEISLSSLQLVITIIWLIIKIVGINSNYDVTIIPLTFAVIALVDAFKAKDESSSLRFDHEDEEAPATRTWRISDDQEDTNPSTQTRKVASSDISSDNNA